MNPFSCIVLDDEKPAQDLIENYINKIPELQLIRKFDDPKEALLFLKENLIDIIFTDIRMPKLSGIDFIKTLPKKPYIIIISAYSQYALEGYELDIIDYIRKPVSYDRFKKSVEKIIKINSATKKSLLSNLERFFVKEGGKITSIETKNILYVEGMKDYIKIKLTDNLTTIVTHLSMKKIEELLPDSNFLRTHRSYIVAIDKITSLDIKHNVIKLKGNIEIPVGVSYREDLKESLKSVN